MPSWKELSDRIGDNVLSPQGFLRAAREHFGRVQEAESTSDLTSLLSTTIGKKVVTLMNTYTPVWSQFCYIDETNKLRTNVPRVLISAFPDLDEKPEGSEIEKHNIEDNAYNIQTKTYAKGFSITRETWVNDDTGTLREMPYRMVTAATRTLERTIAAYIRANGTAYDSTAFFAARTGTVTHNNTTTSTLARTLTGAGYITAGCLVIKKAKDLKDIHIMGYQPRFLITAPDITDTAATLCTAEAVANTTETSANVSLANPARRENLQHIEWPYLGDTNNWYICTDPQVTRGDSGVIVSFLNGRTAPMVMQKKTIYDTASIEAFANNPCDIEFDLIYDFGVSFGNFRTWYGGIVSGGAETIATS